MAKRDYLLMLKAGADLQPATAGLSKLDAKFKTTGAAGERAAAKINAGFGKLNKLAGSLHGALLALGGGLVFKDVIEATTRQEDALRQLGQRLKSTGGAAGLTKKDLVDLAGAMQQVTTYGDEAVEEMEALLLSFKNIHGNEYKRAVEATLDMSAALGQDLKASALAVGRALDNPVKGLTALQRVGIIFTDQQKAQIKALVDAGQAAKAQGIILDALAGKMGGTARAAAQTFGGALKQLKNAFGDLLEGDGGNLTDAGNSIRELTTTLQSPDVKAGFAAMVSGLVSLTSETAKAISAFNGLRVAVTDVFSRTADKSYNGLLNQYTDLSERIAAVQKRLDQSAGQRFVNAAKPSALSSSGFLGSVASIYSAVRGSSTSNLRGELARLEKERQEVQAELQKRRDAPLKNQIGGAAGDFIGSIYGNGSGSAKPVVDPKKAAKAAAELKAANDKLAASVDSLRTQTLTPTQKVWDDYIKAVQQAAEAGGEAIKHGADVGQVQQQVADAVTYAAKIREGALTKLSEQAKQAYEQLREALRTPAEAATETAQAQIQTLNDALQKGIIKSAEYTQQTGRVVNQAFTKAPQYQGLAPEVGGAFSELFRNDQAQAQLEKWYQQQIALLNTFREKKIGTQQEWDAKEISIKQQHDQQMTQIEQARQQAQLQISSSLFGQLAQLSTSHNKKMARIGKATAIAQAIINTYQSATEAYAAMASIPYVGPALGAAAAAAAIAAGLENVAQIRQQSVTNGYAEGGYTGHGGKYQRAGDVHKGETVIRRESTAQPGMLPLLLDINQRGMAAVEDFAAEVYGYAQGGLVGARDLPTPPVRPLRMPAQIPSPANSSGHGHATQFKIINVFDPEHAAHEIATTPVFERAVINKVTENPTTVRHALFK
ncbi:phage tail length tape measure family protein [Oleiagrimonas sp. C23AA]|uniref:phage tail length tape measure family protein n=1 Tax=Oleiagrimonas sp. C23AA TaxID=2719047 RepID=UPI00141F18A2|nr:phage tail length tape measure family protein [Oleiagrimonas sp. C23AA]NII11760.1 hypothetical protein [Oleiagrimonas sp. C23AA]